MEHVVTQHWVSIDGPFASGATVPYHHFLIAAVLVLCVLHLCDWGSYLSCIGSI